ncbi:hypothetical protein HHI36_019336 [Cryptolaemus montrouzieri]|uniref:Gustatory receptor n=1 Tax=Cryptolaemus montrouzieri TaxID=559131 RepID=A0ABD2P2M1_9CUCU
MQGSIGETRIFRRNLYIVATIALGSFVLQILSHVYVAVLRSENSEQVPMLDNPLAVMIRGAVQLYTSFEIIIVFIFCSLIALKYKYLANITSRTMEHFYIQAGGKRRQSLIRYTDAITLTLFKGENIPKLHQLERFYQRLTYIVNEVNSTVGLSILAAITSSLYSTMYYLYRFSTASEHGLTSNKKERVHYALGLICRSGKMFSYMLMGSHLLKASQLPLEILRKSRIINIPLEIQQQVQTLMLQWLESKGYLSAGGIVRVGPWLLAPILGNVITYLLVALQFNQSNLEILAASTNNSVS